MENTEGEIEVVLDDQPVPKKKVVRNFTTAETDNLVELYVSEEIQSKLQSNQRSHRHVWKDLSALMKTRGFDRTDSQLSDKIKNLKCTYYTIKRTWKTGTSPPEWRYWEKFHKLLWRTAVANPPRIIDSLEEEQEPLDNHTENSCLSSSQEETPLLAESGNTTGSGNTGTKKRKRKDETPAVLLERLWTASEKREDKWRQEQKERDDKFLNLFQTIAESVQSCVSRLPSAPSEYVNLQPVPQRSETTPTTSAATYPIATPYQPASFLQPPFFSSVDRPGPSTTQDFVYKPYYN